MQFLDKNMLRGARGILGWSVNDLAQHSGVSAATINSFEQDSISRRGSKLSQTTILKILETFERSGIEITQDGIRKKDLKSYILEGDDANKHLLNDVYNTLKDAGGEVLVSGFTETKPGDKDYDFIVAHVERLKKAGIKERLLIQKGDRNLIAPTEWYRWFPDEEFNTYPFQLYGTKIAMIDWGPPQKIIVIDHKHFAHTYRAMFNAIWNRASPVILERK
jgi:transcriptional regulator with XRE-family HTH domain